MKWTTGQTDLLKQMCFAGTSNADMAECIGVPLEEIHHKRSQLGLTIAKVKALNGTAGTPEATKACKTPKTKKASKPAAAAPEAPVPAAPAALERFQNAGEDCIVLARHEDIALIVMPGKSIAAFCVPLQHRAGETSWWQGHYFDSLDDAYEYYCERVIADEQQS